MRCTGGCDIRSTLRSYSHSLGVALKLSACILSLLFLFGIPVAGPMAASADLVLINGNIYTANDKQPHAEAMAIKADRIVFVGSNAGVKKFQGASTRVIDLHGETVLPGLTDAHY